MSTQEVLPTAAAPVVVPTKGPPVEAAPGLLLEQVHRFSVEEYHRMGEAGVISPQRRTELIEGIVVDMTPISIAHRYAVDALLEILPRMLKPDWYPSGQNPLQLSRSEPEPDVAILRGSFRDYHDRHPQPKDAGLVIEVAETSLDYDRRTKGFLYSKHNVPEYWIVNLVEDCVEVYRPGPGQAERFLPAETFGIGSEVPLALAGRNYGSVRVADLIVVGRSESLETEKCRIVLSSSMLLSPAITVSI
ncbi:MAG: Uma2 family endonuclease [Pirellulales bacterium]